MKTLERRLFALERSGSPGLWYLSDEEVRGRLVSVLGTLEAGGVVLADGWRGMDDLSPVVKIAREQVEAML